MKSGPDPAFAASPSSPAGSRPSGLQSGVWQPIEDMRWPLETAIIVTDGLSVYGAGWWHPGEQAWLDCDGITPTHWMPLPEPPEA